MKPTIPAAVCAAALVLCLTGPALAQEGASAEAERVAEARNVYIDGRYEAALAVLLPAALAGNANAQNIVGDAFDLGLGVERNPAKAREWWEKSAGQGFSKAQFNLGRMLAMGREGVSRDADLAEKHLKDAAAQGNAEAFNELGLIYALGRGRAVDHAKAADFYRQGAEQGSIIAMSNLGAAYATGKGVETDMAQAHDWIGKAAAGGEAQALHNLAVLYRDGLHVATDKVVAYHLFRASQTRGYAKAGHQIADMMRAEDSPFGSPVQALAYCLWGTDAAGEAGAGDLFLNCDEIASGLSEDDRAEAAAQASAL